MCASQNYRDYTQDMSGFTGVELVGCAPDCSDRPQGEPRSVGHASMQNGGDAEAMNAMTTGQLG